MTEIEILTIIGGLIVGWILVSKLITKYNTSGTSPIENPEAKWNEVLNVPLDASSEAIRKAYESKLADLSRTQLSMMTQPEMEAHNRIKDQIESAYRKATDAAKPT